LLSFEKSSWSKVNDLIKGDKIPALSMHAMVDVFPDEVNSLPGISIFKHPEVLTDVNNTRTIKVGL